MSVPWGDGCSRGMVVPRTIWMFQRDGSSIIRLTSHRVPARLGLYFYRLMFVKVSNQRNISKFAKLTPTLQQSMQGLDLVSFEQNGDGLDIGLGLKKSSKK